jgi:excisionase family DNA binding protein
MDPGMAEPPVTTGRVDPVPSLDELAHDPTKVASLAPEVRRGVILRCASILAACATPGESTESVLAPDDRLLTVREAATKLRVSRDTLYRQASRYPFTVRLGTRVRFSLQGLERYCRQRQGRA